ncbi:copper resistance protein CopC [Phenylobacterium sp.]|uniref:copper resistance protein CopC n=1 Tax=Phenylobacterium sp. TaxID=1871053 RepID=UPI0027321477|nr:copper resistance protein CopC [Phenylobacterium sp.]MDP1873155.1 copper resistance protein CopC [Phenylobacterium sp.]MDP3491300.1 copper resistance protein CopC [Phenylobacterium sp.]
MRHTLLALALSTLSLGAAAPALAQDHHAGHGAPSAPADHAAHGVVTSPAEGEMTHGAPDWFTATFEHPMTLTAVTVAGEGKPAQTVPVAAAAATTEVSADLPDLAPGRYVLTWTAKGADGHEMTGAVRFMVH